MQYINRQNTVLHGHQLVVGSIHVGLLHTNSHRHNHALVNGSMTLPARRHVRPLLMHDMVRGWSGKGRSCQAAEDSCSEETHFACKKCLGMLEYGGQVKVHSHAFLYQLSKDKYSFVPHCKSSRPQVEGLS